MEDINKIVKSLEDFGLLLKGLVKQFIMKLKMKKEDFLVCYQVHLVQVYQVKFQEVKE